MCGRFEIHSEIEILLRMFQVDSAFFDLKPAYNIAPAQQIATVVNEEGKNRLVPCTWGFVPSWSKDEKTGYQMINARSETIATNKAFKDAFLNSRCIVPADGFFEWSKQGKARQPLLVRLRSRRPMGLAGLYSVRRTEGSEEKRTCTIITVSANEAVAPVHDRMPAILREEQFGAWLDPALRDSDRLLPLLKPCPASEIEMFPVTPKMNSVGYDDSENIRPVGPASQR